MLPLLSVSGPARPPETAPDASPRRESGVGRHAFTVDVEDWYQGIPVDKAFKESAERRLESGLSILLELLSRTGTRGTFFLLGPVAAEHPELVKEIARGGHEVGCHGWSHDLLYEMSRERMREETRRARETIEAITGGAVTAYRAAYFSITRRSFWALEVLAELGFRYDSSIFPVHNWRYGIPDFEPRPQRIETPSGPILELPLSVRPIGRLRLPISGGAYFRLYPYALTRANFHWAERAGRPAVFYLHPWELDPDHPRVRFDWRARLTHYANLRSTKPKLERLLSEFRFGPLGEVLEDELTPPRP
jgi:polysaccharide deacetylase family protein (PEP-CTERM system associated)